MKKNVMIIGAGGVAHVAAHKAAMNNDILGDICIASRTQAKCDAIIESVIRKGHLKNPDGRLYSALWNYLVHLDTEKNQYARTAWRQTPRHVGGFVSDAGVHNIAVLRFLAVDWENLQIGCDIDQPGSSAEFLTGNWRTTGRPVTDKEKCIKCGFCWLLCPDNAYAITPEGYYAWDQRYCKGCGVCVVECPKKAIEMKEES